MGARDGPPAVAALERDLADWSARPPEAAQFAARAQVERLALALQAATLLRGGSPLADTFCRSRLGGARGAVFGTLSDADAVERALARLDATVTTSSRGVQA